MSAALLAAIGEHALCTEVDSEIFFPHPGGNPLPAKAICARCPVRRPCLEYAVEHQVAGVWGGTTADQRRHLSRGAVA